MREKKFRILDKKRKKIWYPGKTFHSNMVDPDNCGSLIYCDIEQVAIGMDGTIYILDECGNCECPENINENYKPLFYTGHKDKNGKEIYEGDILYGNDGWIDVVEPVFYEERTSSFYPFGRYDSVCNRYWQTKDCENIGNVFENPELIKECWLFYSVFPNHLKSIAEIYKEYFDYEE